MEPLPVDIRWMIRRNMPEVLKIEEHSFTFAWSEDDFVRCLRQRNCIGMVATNDDEVVGFMVYELHPTRIHLINFAVSPQWRRHGVGHQMVEKLKGKLSQHRRTTLDAVVREGNVPAQLFFKAMNFRAVSLLRGYYVDSSDDAYHFQYSIRPAKSHSEDMSSPLPRPEDYCNKAA